MFVFERLEVYKKSVLLYCEVNKLSLDKGIGNKIIANQINRSVLSISLNIAEGAGKESLKDRKNYLLISRGSLYETVAVLNILKENNTIDQATYNRLYSLSEEISKMLYVMINQIRKKISGKQ